MRKSRKKILLLMLVFAVFAIQVPVSLGLSVNDNYGKTPLQADVTNMDYLSSNLSDSLQSSDIVLGLTLDNEMSIFDNNLRQFLTNQTLNSQNDVEDVKIIVLFEEDVYPIVREEILNSVFNDFTIITHYDIISGTYLKLNPMELLSNERKRLEAWGSH